MKRRLLALLQAGGSLPTVRGYMGVVGCFLLQLAVLILRAAGNLPPPAQSK